MSAPSSANQGPVVSSPVVSALAAPDKELAVAADRFQEMEDEKSTYELVKAVSDENLSENVQKVREQTALRNIDVQTALNVFAQVSRKSVAEESKFDLDMFETSFRALVGEDKFDEEDCRSVFGVLDSDSNGSLDLMELCTGVSMMCSGTAEEKIQAVFSVVDEDGDGTISPEEMFRFLLGYFSVVVTPKLLEELQKLAGPDLEISVESLAGETMNACFDSADKDGDGSLSVEEFTAWFQSMQKSSGPVGAQTQSAAPKSSEEKA